MTKPVKKRLLPLLIVGVMTLVLCLCLVSALPVLTMRWFAPPTSAFMLQTAWQDKHPVYIWVDSEAISPQAGLAVIAAEDQTFPQHHGFDLLQIQASIYAWRQGDDLRGASTISQQVAKNLFLWPGRNIGRKGLEAWFTVLIELFWPKQRILEMYLNIAEFGPGIHGVEAASQQYFGIPAAELNADQAALLAAVLPNPKLLSVSTPSDYVKNRQHWILQQMHQLGGTDYLTRLLPDNP
ncbi:MAG: monofunctional biosynthetic peptidoglycan transglycosylase [Gammaproteobacteria bacterium]